ncbi:T9SS C-terminal target domain-containing protein [candidate division KSB1 bacterium]|nr:MAG: T9SS C-terminal target domain-containing protein [candidate division KSB1 bacterium]
MRTTAFFPFYWLLVCMAFAQPPDLQMHQSTEATRQRGGFSLGLQHEQSTPLDENVNLRHSNIDIVTFCMDTLFGYETICSWWDVFNPFSPEDNFTVDVARIHATPEHLTQYYWNIFVPERSPADPDPGNPNFSNALYDALTIQGDPYGSARIFPVTVDAGLGTEDFLFLARAYDDSIHFVSVDPHLIPVTHGLHVTVTCYPNPSNAKTIISLALPHASKVSLAVYDIMGHEVCALYEGMLEAGEQRYAFDGSLLPSGIYFARLDAGTFSQTKKLMLLK